ncbi:MAG: NAD(P)-binding protein [Actinomycetota bacterium]
MPSSAIDTVVIGAGQSGLAMSHHLSARGVPHVVLERARVGERWRTERWDSLRFQFPSVYVRLPGFDYDGDDPDGFMGRDRVVEVLERYANHIGAPVRTGVDGGSRVLTAGTTGR